MTAPSPTPESVREAERILALDCPSAQHGECGRQRGDGCSACDEIRKEAIINALSTARRERAEKDARIAEGKYASHWQSGLKQTGIEIAAAIRSAAGL